MRKIILIALLLFLCPIAWAEGPAAKPAKDEIHLTPDLAKALKSAFDAAKKTGDDLQRAYDANETAKAKLQAAYWQAVATMKIDLDKYEITTDEDGGPVFRAKTPPPTEEKKEGGK